MSAPALIHLPPRLRTGEVFEVRAMVAHPMETGFRSGNDGARLPRHIIEQFECRYNGALVFQAELHPAITANPFIAFFLRATQSGELECSWRDDRGNLISARARVQVE